MQTEQGKNFMSDHPWEKVVTKASQLLKEHPQLKLYQKFTCAGCGNRLTMEVPNTFYETGTCDNCNTVTYIKEQGCNYMAVWS